MYRYAIDKLVLGLILASLAPAENLRAQDPTRAESEGIQTVDHFVPHISTVPANSGQAVELFVREKIRSRDEHDGPEDSISGNRHQGRRYRPNGPVVLMIHGATVSVVPGFDLQFENYSWMDYLARAGFDVFAMDLQGYGLSPRPMMDDPCNISPAEQKLYLIPKTLSEPCSPRYPFQLTSIQSDWDEIDTVVDYLRQLRGAEKVSLVSWSRGGPRAGGYAAQHPEKVERLFLYAPGYKRLAPSDPPAVLPQPGVPMTVLGSAAFHNDWNAQVQCVNQFTTQIRDVITSTMLAFDPLGSTWGTAGVRRAPIWNSPSQVVIDPATGHALSGFPWWGWNAALANQVKVPTLVIRGDLDITVPEQDDRALLADLVAPPQKVFVHVACASHYLVWENQHMVLLRGSEEWLKHGTFAGQANGSFAVDSDGRLHREQ